MYFSESTMLEVRSTNVDMCWYPTGRVEKEEVWEIPCQRRGNLLCCRIYLNFTPALLVGRGFVIAAECQMGPTGAISINLGMSSSDPTPINHTPRVHFSCQPFEIAFSQINSCSILFRESPRLWDGKQRSEPTKINSNSYFQNQILSQRFSISEVISI